MSGAPNTLFLRLEGPLQAWGDTSKFVIRRTMDAPTKSGVIGLICCARGLSRQAARERLPKLNESAMGVRIDRPGVRWWDYHTVGAGYGLLKAEGKIKRTASTRQYETLVSRREYLCDSSFLVALQGDSSLIQEVAEALAQPEWPLFLGRKCCPPSVPVLARPSANESWTNPMHATGGLLEALQSVPWRPRCQKDKNERPDSLDCLLEWRAAHEGDIAPSAAEVWYDAPASFDPPVHEPRLVERTRIRVQAGRPLQYRTPSPSRPRAGYGTKAYDKIRGKRLDLDHHLCVFCKVPLRKYTATVQHLTYRHATSEDYLAASGDEDLKKERLTELRSLCRLCHDAVTMIEYGLGMGLDRINPEDPRWRAGIIEKCKEIVAFRSLETRRRKLAAEEVE